MVSVIWCVTAVAFAPGAAVSQATDGGARSVAREWQLRGVVISPSDPIAILEHVPSGRQQLVRVGDGVADGIAVTAIAPERVVLDTTEDDVILRLGHGGPSRRAPAPPPVRVRWRAPHVRGSR